MMKITICDDSLQEIETLTELCRRYGRENDIEMEIKGVSDPALVLAEEDEAGRVLGYLDEIDVIGESLRFVSTNNMIGDAILNQYERMCREAGICLMVDGKFPEHMAASETGLCIVLSNGMKNAYDAALQCEEKRFIEVAINNDGEHYVFLVIRNSCCGPLKLQEGIPVTAKDDKKNHGLGTRNMMEAATKFGGSVVWRAEEGIVITEILIPA